MEDDEDDYDPYEGYDDDFCECDDYDADILEGRAHCLRCGRTWWLSDEQMKQELRFQVEYAEMVEEEMRKP